MERNKTILKTSVIGIVTNIFLVIFKSAVGFFVNSIAIILDAVNNLTDIFSSVITIIGAKLSSKAPDKKHPYGHGRIEYFSSIIVSVIIFMAGILAIKESIVKIIDPDNSNYSIIALVIIAVTIVVKLFLGKYYKKIGKKVNSRYINSIRSRCSNGCSFIIFNTSRCNFKLYKKYKY